MGVTLLLALCLSQAPVEAPRVRSVELRLPPQTDPSLVAEVPDLVAVRKGQELSLRAVRRTIERLIETGHFSDVVVRTIADAGGVDVVIELSPMQVLSEAYVDGNKLISSSELVSLTRLERGGELPLERVAEAEEAIRQAYRRKGYRRVEVRSQRVATETGIEVTFLVVEGEPTRLQSLVFAGETGLPLVKMLGALQLETGRVVDSDALEAGLDRLRELLKKEQFYRARVEPAVVDDDGHLAISVRSGPRLQLRIAGNRTFADTALLGINGYEGAELLDRTVVERMAVRLEDWYRYQGFHDAQVTPRETVSPDGARGVVTFDVDEGPRLLVRQLRFEGNRAIDEQELKGVLNEVMRNSAPEPVRLVNTLSDALQAHGRTRDPEFYLPYKPETEQVLVESAWAEAAVAMRALYRDRGYLAARVELASVDIDARSNSASVRFAIDEGPLTRYQKLSILGAPDGALPVDKDWVTLGTPFSARSLEVTRQKLAQVLEKGGWLFARVEGQYTVEEGTRALVTFRVAPGPRVSVGKVILKGLVRTAESVVRKQVLLAESKPLNIDQLLDTQRNLIGLGIFRTVEVRVLSPDAVEPVKDVLVEVQERPRLSGEFAIGYFLAEGPRVVVDVQYPNAGGRAISLQAHVQVNYFAASAPAISKTVNVEGLAPYQLIGGRANLSASNRGLLPFEIGSRLDLLAERVFRPSYQFSRIAGAPGLDWSTLFAVPFVSYTRLKMTLAMQYEIDASNVLPVSSEGSFPLLPTDQERLRFSFGTFVLHTFRLSSTFDLRDSPANPHRGGILQATFERTGDIYAVDNSNPPQPVTVNFVKLSGLVTTYLPLTRALVLALSVRGGKIFPLVSGSVSPPVKRFYLGGASSMRGFGEDNLIAEDSRAALRNEVANCQALVSNFGCTSGAAAVQSGQQAVSQGGELFYVGKAELRFPVLGQIDLGVFFEVGDLWLGAPTAFTLRPVAGAGVRYVTPIGPLALDVGVNLHRDAVVNEPSFVLNFNVGVF